MSDIKKIILVVDLELSNIRLDKFLVKMLAVEKYGLSREKIKQLILQERVILNKDIEKSPNKTVREGDQLEVSIPKPRELNIVAKKIDIDVIYEDNDLIVINKQPGLTTHPGNGNRDHTLVNALLAYKPDNLSGIGGVERPGIVHRLDKNTSGLIIVAKNDYAHLELSRQLQERTLKREYIALIWGIMSPDKGCIDLNIVRSSRNRKLMDTSCVNGKVAITNYETSEIFLNGLLSLVKCQLHTGRTHQIRVHFSHSGHGVFGDPEYGNHLKKLQKYFDSGKDRLLFDFKRQALHAEEIKFQHPVSKKDMQFSVEIPDDFMCILKHVRGF